MAKSVLIQRERNACKIVVDGSEIKDVMSYVFEESGREGATLTLKIAVMRAVEVLQGGPNL